MDLSTAKWLSELEMDDPAVNNQWQMMNSIDQSVNDDISFDQFSSSNHESRSTHQSFGTKKKLPHEASQTTTIIKPSVQLINKNKDSRLICTSQKPSSSPFPRIISFGNENCNFSARSSQQQCIVAKPKYTVKTESDEMMALGLGSIDFSSDIFPNSFYQEQYGALEYGIDPFKKGSCRTPLQAQDHVLAERKRREKLSQQFIALSVIVPGLKKLDKASVIGGAIKHIKQLEGRVKFFEEEEKKKRPREESVVSAIRRPRTSSICYTTNDDASSSDENVSDDRSCDQESSSAAQIEVRISGGDVLIRVQCKKHTRIMVGFFSEMENIHLSITSSSFMPFGHDMLLINAVAQMDEEFCMTAEVLANNIRQALLKLS